MKVLVTGGAGFLGRYIVEALLARRYSVRALGRKSYPELESLGVECICADLSDSDAIARACEGMDVVFHVASHVSLWGEWQTFYKTNVLGTKNIIAACKLQGVKKLIYTSTPSVAFNGSDLLDADESTQEPSRYLSYYPRSKKMAEDLVLAANARDGLLTISLRPHLIWGPGDKHLIPSIVEKAKKGRLAIIGEGKNKVDFTYVENVVQAHLCALDALREGAACAGKAYFISQAEPVELWDFLGKMFRHFKAPLPSKRIPTKVAYILASLMEFFYKVLRLKGEPRLTRFLVLQLATSHYFSNAAAKRDLGYEPSVSMEEGMRRYFATENTRLGAFL